MRFISCCAAFAVLAATLGGCMTRPVALPVPSPAPVAEIVITNPGVTAPAPLPPPPARFDKISLYEEIMFSPGRAELLPAGRAALAKLLAGIVGAEVDNFHVTGHADERSKPEQVMRLSTQRNEAVIAYLAGRGFDTAKIVPSARGSSDPADSSMTAAGRARNDRVVVEITAALARDADPASWMPNDVVSVLYATNRKRTGSEKAFTFYGNQLAAGSGPEALEHGVAAVRIPRERERGGYRRPPSTILLIDRIAGSFGVTDLPSVLSINPDKHFLFEHTLKVLTPERFKSTLREAVKVSRAKAAILYIHGYNNDFTDAAFRTAQMVYDMAEPNYDLVPLMFSWPSNPGIPGVDYKRASERTEASADALAIYLREIAQNTDIGTVHIVAHSMGSRVLTGALQKLGASKELTVEQNGEDVPVFKHIVFAAADISPADFNERIAPAIRSRHTVTSYVSSDDKILLLSWARNRQARIGFGLKHLPMCVDNIDVSATGNWLGHSTWAESPRVIDDLRQLVRYSIAPARRGLSARTSRPSPYWAFEKKAPRQTPVDERAYSTVAPCTLPSDVAAVIR